MTSLTTPLPRSCPRCAGRLFHSRDVYGGYSSCVCCGFVQEWLSGPAIDLPNDRDGTGRQRRRQPSHRMVRL
jgi:hypothetical protein